MVKHDSMTVDEIVAALEAYGLGDIHNVVPIGEGHENRPHRASADAGCFLVKVLVPRLSGLPALEARHALADHLAEAGVRVPRLIRTTDGRGCVRERAGAIEVYEWIDGRPARSDNPMDAEKTGVALAELHVASLSFGSPGPGCRRDWLTPEGDLERLSRIERRMQTYVPAPEMFAPLNSVRDTLRETAGQLASADLPVEMVHGSVLPANILIDADGEAWLTDLDYCHRAPMLFDLGTAMTGLATCEEALLQRYERARPLTEAERGLLGAVAKRVLIHLRLDEGVSVERIAGELRRLR